jgi:hypothetical protein
VNAISFINERTADYILVPQLISLLSGIHARIVPFYFWSQREGSTMGQWCESGVPVRFVAAFSRRPKITEPNASRIQLKINGALLEAANTASGLGIPVLAGMPLVSTIYDLNLDAACAWFALNATNEEPADVEIVLQADGALVSKSRDTTAVDGPLELDTLPDIVQERSSVMTWQEGIENVRAILASMNPERRFFFGSTTYRPFFLMLVPPSGQSARQLQR